MKNKRSLYSLTLAELRDILGDNKLPKFTADQVYDWIYRKWNRDMNLWTNVSKKIKAFITEELDDSLPEIIWNGLSIDGTRKFLLKLRDGNSVESVAIPSKDRLSICISSQIGCALGCKFCYTGTQGFTRNLEVAEIVGQFAAIANWLVQNVDPELRLSNVVFMGQGEPLHNFENIKQATIILMEGKGIALGQRKITLSTAGVAPVIEKLADFPPINIAISLHSALDETRSKLMPINKIYNLEKLFASISKIPLKAYRRITYEYLLIDGLNDTLEEINSLCKLLKPQESKINLIPCNDYPGSEYKKPSDEDILWFMDQLIQRGYTCTIRQSKGTDILAACGQLKSEYDKLNLWD